MLIIEQTEHIEAFNEALAKAQGKMKNPEKDGVNTHFSTEDRKARYATLAAVIDAIREPLSSEGISFQQFPAVTDRGQVCITRLTFKDQWVQATMPLIGEIRTMQVLGSAYSYARRYSLMMMTGVAGDDDDDGNAASAPAAPSGGQPKGQRGQDRGRGGQAPPGPSRAPQGAPAQGGGQVSPPSDPKLAEEVRLLKQRREEAAQQKSRDLMLQADTAFAAFVEGYAAGLTSPASVDELAGVCRELQFPKGAPADAIRSAINQARARIAAATQTT